MTFLRLIIKIFWQIQFNSNHSWNDFRARAGFFICLFLKKLPISLCRIENQYGWCVF